MHLIFSGALPIYQANVYIREQSVPKGHSVHACITVPPWSASWDWQIEIFPFVKHFLEICNINFIHLSLSIFSFCFSFFKKRCHSFKNHLLESRLLIHRMLPISHLSLPLRNQKTCHVVSGETCTILLFITSCMPECLKKTPFLNSSSQSDNISLWKVNILSLFQIQLYSGLSLHGMQVLYLGYIKLCFNNIHWLFFIHLSL